MGFKRPEVQILSPRPRRSKRCIACSDFLRRCALTPRFLRTNRTHLSEFRLFALQNPLRLCIALHGIVADGRSRGGFSLDAFEHCDTALLKKKLVLSATANLYHPRMLRQIAIACHAFYRHRRARGRLCSDVQQPAPRKNSHPRKRKFCIAGAANMLKCEESALFRILHRTGVRGCAV